MSTCSWPTSSTSPPRWSERRAHDGTMAPRLDDISWPVRTERLTIRRFAGADTDALWQIRRQDSVGQWMTAASKDLDEFREKFKDADRVEKTLVVELDGRVIGDVMIAVEDAWSQAEVTAQARGVQAELGWCLDPAYEGRGYATEAVGTLLRLCFDELGLRRVTANCFAGNRGSWRLMERLGMRREAYNVRDSLHRSGEWLDGMTYALL